MKPLKECTWFLLKMILSSSSHIFLSLQFSPSPFQRLSILSSGRFSCVAHFFYYFHFLCTIFFTRSFNHVFIMGLVRYLTINVLIVVASRFSDRRTPLMEGNLNGEEEVIVLYRCIYGIDDNVDGGRFVPFRSFVHSFIHMRCAFLECQLTKRWKSSTT